MIHCAGVAWQIGCPYEMKSQLPRGKWLWQGGNGGLLHMYKFFCYNLVVRWSLPQAQAEATV